MILSISALALITIVNILGVSKVKAIQTPIVIMTVGLLIFICVASLFSPNFDANRPIDGAFSTDIWTLAETAAFVFVAYAGVTKVAAIGGEVKQPEKNLPAGIMLSLLIATVIYTLIAFLMMASIPGEWWIVDGEVVEDPIYVFAEQVVNTEFGVLAAILSVLTMISMALAGILASSRFLFAMARDNLLPQPLEDVSVKFETPHIPIIITGIAMALAILFVPLKDVVKLASGFKIMIFMLINSTVIVLRRLPDGETWYTPSFKSPMYPAMQIFGIVSGFVLLVLMGTSALIGAVAAIGIGSGIYISYSRKKVEENVTPWRIIRSRIFNQEQYEVEKWWLVFNACAHSKHPDHLTLKEFIKALDVLQPSIEPFHARALFHEIDADGDGMIDIEEFVGSMSDGKFESE